MSIKNVDDFKKGLVVKQVRLIEDIKRKMFATMNQDKEGSYERLKQDVTLESLLLGTHSPINIVIFEVSGWVPDRVHSHLRTHSGIQRTYWCGTSRLDIPYGGEFKDGDGELWRYINFDLSIDALIHISKRRLCTTAHHLVRNEWNNVVNQCIDLMPVLRPFCVRPCVWFGMCTEPRKDCGYIESKRGIEERHSLRNISDKIAEKSS